MTLTRRTLGAALLAAFSLIVASGCGPTKNYVDHVTWLDNDTFYMAYVEQQPLKAGQVKLRRCRIDAQNNVTCDQQTQAESVLNAD